MVLRNRRQALPYGCRRLGCGVVVVLILALLLAGCNGTVVKRTYNITITVSENSVVNFTPEILAEMVKESEVRATTKADVSTDAVIDTGVIP